ncbi:phosphate acyltransferase PlsX [Prosthecomicrobium hirschii]|uniref:phosphate acyltransferase PlsX n=1 Tax=Prosthecodimorpha hirschii TaxID=665126 RepID=UPI00112C78CF|nr:phosphate acyltransferase PlsX [Prosthecomicrobium hirschii]MCW1840127.1 phosphate acyltransferase PlsX [Prosthecomicrobium hirschii]TPQ50033.1 phosphate acyltransferase PlsX [Prosthecomicrobium hirschii]
MAKPIILSIDAMGGDAGPDMVIPGVALAVERRPDLRFLIYGDSSVIAPLIKAHPRLEAACELIHTDVVVRMDDKPSQALRAGRWKSSMWKAIEAVKTGQAMACVSAGNTGALMAMSRFCLRGLGDVQRPAIAAIWPTTRGESIVLDVGATVGADARQLVDFAVMGSAMASAVFDLERPKVGLLNVGVEEIKGVEQVKDAAKMLRAANLPGLDYVGFVEGDDIGRGTVDVVVTEGFAGNIALKTAEGTAKQIAQYLRQAMTRSLLAKLGYILARSAFDRLREKMDPRKVNGGVFLGLNGIVIKSHGGTDAEGFASAVELGYDMVVNDLMAKIAQGISNYHRAGGSLDLAVAEAGED